MRSTNHSYDLFAVIASTTDNYTLATQTSINTYGYLYFPSFNATSPLSNVVASNDDFAGTRACGIRYTLQAGIRYFLVVTNYYPSQTGSYTLFVKGPALVNITRLSSMYSIQTSHFLIPSSNLIRYIPLYTRF